LMDLGSTNGTFVNERDVDREQLSDGDVITFGMTKASFVGDQPRPRPGPARAMPQRAAVAQGLGRGAGSEPEVAPEGIVADKQREDELKKLQKELDEKETYYSPAELERERKRMEGAIEADRRRETETLQRQIKELEHRVAIRGAESDTVARQLKEKDDLIRMLSDREDELQKDIKSRDEKVAGAQEEVNAAREQLNGAAGKEKELNDKLKQKNVQLA